MGTEDDGACGWEGAGGRGGGIKADVWDFVLFSDLRTWIYELTICLLRCLSLTFFSRLEQEMQQGGNLLRKTRSVH